MKLHLPLCLLFIPIFLLAAEWPQFRGPAGQGHSTATDLPTTWSADEHIAWRTEMPGRGWSSPLIDGNTIWLTTAYETEANEEEKKKRLEKDTGGQKLTVLSELKLTLLRRSRSGSTNSTATPPPPRSSRAGGCTRSSARSGRSRSTPRRTRFCGRTPISSACTRTVPAVHRPCPATT